ncbi:hypothetical protein GCM10022291_34920 [Postechiella marina]|uniref:DUF2007 domain-containing protein n=1 Tax=Postechiella marina TaxID=943941 RepID=A0ABP8CIH5_9FLAO
MLNYIKVFSGNFTEVQRIFNELKSLNICAIIREKSMVDRLASSASSNQGPQQILVHKEEHNRAITIIKDLIAKYTKN